MKPENRNMILAITLSMAVLFGWQIFVVGPELEKEAAMQQAIAEREAASAAASGDAPQVDSDAVVGSAGATTTGELSAIKATPAVEARLQFGRSISRLRSASVVLKKIVTFPMFHFHRL